MTKWHLNSRKTPTGAKVSKLRKKKKRDRGSVFLETKISKRKSKFIKSRGNKMKMKLMSIEEANISDGKTITKTKILAVAENAANIHYVRRNVITKGAVIKTERGLARVTSRPGNDSVINAVLIEKGKK